MFALMTVLTLGELLAPVGEPAQKEKKETVVREIDIKGLKREFPRGSAEKPTAITSAEELAKALPEAELQERLKKEVDFAKEQLLFFAWSGSGQDKVTFQVEDGKKGPEVVFQYQRGLTRDLRAHFRLFAIPKGATWRVQAK